MDLSEAQTVLSYLKANRNRVELRVPQLERRRIGATPKGLPGAGDQLGQEARLLTPILQDLIGQVPCGKIKRIDEIGILSLQSERRRLDTREAKEV